MTWPVFSQAFLAQLLPLLPETTLDAIRRFHPEQYAHAAVVAAVASLLAAAMLYAIGIKLRKLPAKISTPEQQVRIERLRLVAQEWLAWALLLAPAPFGMLLVVAAGFFGIDKWRAALMVSVAEVLWRGAPLLQ
ncbi:MAG: hypothetical protein WDN72_02915 [Alphaproteobacteria bacterium]